MRCVVRMLDREGPEALTFRAVARELDVTVGALSRYFKNLADLEDEVAASIMSGLRPPDGTGKAGLRQELLRFGMDLLEVHCTHPYLLKIHGPASAAVTARLTRDSLKVLVDAGIDVDRAVALYALLGNLPYAWATSRSRPADAEQEARIAQAFTTGIGEFSSALTKLLVGGTKTGVYRSWLALYIDGVLAGTAAGKDR